MSRIFYVLIIMSLSLVLLSCQSNQRKTEIVGDEAEVSYAIGLDVGSNMKTLEFELDIDFLIQGIQDTLMGKKVLLTKRQQAEARQKVQKLIRETREAKIAEQHGENKEAGQKFLAENKTKEGVKTTASGLQYKVLKEGTGAKPKATDKVSVHYKGTVIDGTEFDSSFKRNKPAEFKLNQVIPGWTEGLQLMNVGSKYEFYIPYDLAYGARQQGKHIKPFSTLIFEVELLGIVN